MEKYSHDIRRFVDAMVYKLNRNSKKGRWEGGRIQEYLEKLREEVLELSEGVQQRNTIDIILEAADVANFALIISSMAMDGGHE